MLWQQSTFSTSKTHFIYRRYLRPLPAPEGDKVVPVLNKYIRHFTQAGLPVYATRDWHPKETRHFAAFGGQWPPHCVQGTKGAEFHSDLRLPLDTTVISAGIGPEDEGYSGFEGVDSEGVSFDERLREAGVVHLYVGGIATDYCVRATVLDALKDGFEVTLLTDAIAGIDVNPGDSERAVEEMKQAGAKIATVDEVSL